MSGPAIEAGRQQAAQADDDRRERAARCAAMRDVTLHETYGVGIVSNGWLPEHLPNIDRQPEASVALLDDHAFTLSHQVARNLCLNADTMAQPSRMETLQVDRHGHVVIRIETGDASGWHNQVLRVPPEAEASIADAAREAVAAHIRHTPTHHALEDWAIEQALLAAGSPHRLLHSVNMPPRK